jgi:hypothetical protein
MSNIHRSDTEPDGNMISKLIRKREFVSVRLLFVLSCLLGLLFLISGHIALCCALPLAQVVIIPSFCVIVTLPRLQISRRSKQLATGVKISTMVSAIPSIISFISQDIHYFLLGGRDVAYGTLQKVLPSLTTQSVLISIYSNVLFLGAAIAVSAIIGLILASAIHTRLNDA